jgi:hypothetical protein
MGCLPVTLFRPYRARERQARTVAQSWPTTGPDHTLSVRCKFGRTSSTKRVCSLTTVLDDTRSDNRLRQRRQEQDKADAEQDDILEEKFAGQIPGYWIRRKAPFYDSRRRKEE